MMWSPIRTTTATRIVWLVLLRLLFSSTITAVVHDAEENVLSEALISGDLSNDGLSTYLDTCIPLNTDGTSTQLVLGNVVDASSSSSSSAAATTRTSAPTLPTTTCFVVPEGMEDSRYQIVSNAFGSYQVASLIVPSSSTTTPSSYIGTWRRTWQSRWYIPLDGMYYCIPLEDEVNGRRSRYVTFLQFTSGATITIDIVEPSWTCINEPIPKEEGPRIYNHLDDIGGGITWVDDRFYVHADYFGYQIAGEENVTTMMDTVRYDIDSNMNDDNNNNHMSMEIVWYTSNDRLEKRFTAYFNANPVTNTWSMYEAKIYDATNQDWIIFSLQPPTIVDEVSATTRGSGNGINDNYNDNYVGGTLEECYYNSNLTLTTTDNNGQQHAIYFYNVTLAPFLPWTNLTTMYDCVVTDGSYSPHNNDYDIHMDDDGHHDHDHDHDHEVDDDSSFSSPSSCMGDPILLFHLPHNRNEYLLNLTITNCLTILGTAEDTYGLTIVPDTLGRYELTQVVPSSLSPVMEEEVETTNDGHDHDIFHEGHDEEHDHHVDGTVVVSSGYAWNSPVGGIYYCINGNTHVQFVEYVPDATMSIIVDLIPVEQEEECHTTELSYLGYTPIAAATMTTPSDGSVTWSSVRYHLHADSFSYTEAGQDPITINENATNIEITGDPGIDTYMTIEITWYLNGTEKRFYGYFESDLTANTWSMFEARVYNQQEDWITFLPTDNDQNQVNGFRETCYYQSNLTLTTRNDSTGGMHQVQFLNLTLATFLPWTDTMAMNECIGNSNNNSPSNPNGDIVTPRPPAEEDWLSNLFDSCIVLSSADPTIPNELMLHSMDETSSSCFTVPGMDTEMYRLTILPDRQGRYEILHAASTTTMNNDEYDDDGYPSGWVGSGYAWTSPTMGIYYCVQGGTDIAFDTFVEGATISITVEFVPPNAVEECVSTEIGTFSSPIDTGGTMNDALASGGILWSTSRYFVYADYFAYTIAGEETVTMSNADASTIQVDGDPGMDDYMTIEITWYVNEKEKRFNGYINSDGVQWTMFEVRVYDIQEEWITFLPTQENGSEEVNGVRNTCYTRESLVLSTFDENNGDLHQIQFRNVTIATFLPWSDTIAMETCLALPSTIPTEYNGGDDDMVIPDYVPPDDDMGPCSDAQTCAECEALDCYWRVDDDGNFVCRNQPTNPEEEENRCHENSAPIAATSSATMRRRRKDGRSVALQIGFVALGLTLSLTTLLMT